MILFKDSSNMGWSYIDQYQYPGQISWTERCFLLDKKLSLILSPRQQYENLPNGREIYNSNMGHWKEILMKGGEGGSNRLNRKGNFSYFKDQNLIKKLIFDFLFVQTKQKKKRTRCLKKISCIIEEK